MRIRFRPVTLFILVALAVALGLPASASAAAPQVTTSVISPDGTSTAEVDGQVDPEGIGATYLVEYDLQSSDWCTSGGASGSPANTTNPTSLENSFPGPHSVTVELRSPRLPHHRT
jgi:hypothetical protein